MNLADPIFLIGAWVCGGVGVLYCVITFQLLYPIIYVSKLQAVVLAIYALAALVPFPLFIYPGLNPKRTGVTRLGVFLEILVLGLFFGNLAWCFLFE